MLHTLHDGSAVRAISAKELVQIPIWKGNRTIDLAHAAHIRDAIGSRIQELDFGYKIICYNETDTYGVTVMQKYLIDGQHRAHVLREYFLNNMCSEDFTVVVIEKIVQSETEAIDFFNAINNVKAQRWNTDPKLLVNQYIATMEKQFNVGGRRFIRNGATKRPYLGVDRLRDALSAVQLPQEQNRIHEFCQRAAARNAQLLEQLPFILLSNIREGKYYEHAAEVGFMLAVDLKMRWVSDVLEEMQ